MAEPDLATRNTTLKAIAVHVFIEHLFTVQASNGEFGDDIVRENYVLTHDQLCIRFDPIRSQYAHFINAIFTRVNTDPNLTVVFGANESAQQLRFNNHVILKRIAFDMVMKYLKELTPVDCKYVTQCLSMPYEFLMTACQCHVRGATPGGCFKAVIGCLADNLKAMITPDFLRGLNLYPIYHPIASQYHNNDVDLDQVYNHVMGSIRTHFSGNAQVPVAQVPRVQPTLHGYNHVGPIPQHAAPGLHGNQYAYDNAQKGIIGFDNNRPISLIDIVNKTTNDMNVLRQQTLVPSQIYVGNDFYRSKLAIHDLNLQEQTSVKDLAKTKLRNLYQMAFEYNHFWINDAMRQRELQGNPNPVKGKIVGDSCIRTFINCNLAKVKWPEFYDGFVNWNAEQSKFNGAVHAPMLQLSGVEEHYQFIEFMTSEDVLGAVIKKSYNITVKDIRTIINKMVTAENFNLWSFKVCMYNLENFERMDSLKMDGF